jgi:hypothetical protein
MTAPAFRATRGDTLTWTFTIPENITGWTPKWTLKPQLGWPDTLDSAATIVCTTGGGGLTSTPGASSTIDLVVLASVTAAWAPGTYVWDLQLVNGTSTRTIEWDAEGHTVGTLTITADVTRLTS